MSAPDRPPLPARSFSHTRTGTLPHRTVSISSSAISKSLKLLSRVKTKLPNPLTKLVNSSAPRMEKLVSGGETISQTSSTTESSTANLFPAPNQCPQPVFSTPIRPIVCYGLPRDVIHCLLCLLRLPLMAIKIGNIRPNPCHPESFWRSAYH